MLELTDSNLPVVAAPAAMQKGDRRPTRLKGVRGEQPVGELASPPGPNSAKIKFALKLCQLVKKICVTKKKWFFREETGFSCKPLFKGRCVVDHCAILLIQFRKNGAF